MKIVQALNRQAVAAATARSRSHKVANTSQAVTSECGATREAKKNLYFLGGGSKGHLKIKKEDRFYKTFSQCCSQSNIKHILFKGFLMWWGVGDIFG